MHYFDIIITMEEVISIKRKIENCFVLRILDRELNKQKIDYQFYYKCQKICKQFGTQQLKHAKAVLELRKTHSTEMAQLGSLMLSLFSLISATIAIVFVVKTKIDYIGRGLLVCIMWMVAFMMYHAIFIEGYDLERRAYYYSVICDEIERRSREECLHK